MTEMYIVENLMSPDERRQKITMYESAHDMTARAMERYPRATRHVPEHGAQIERVYQTWLQEKGSEA